METKRIYLSPPHLDGRERELLLDAFDSNWITTLGPHVNAFEEEVCRRLRIPHATALASGTAALHLALINLGVDRGDEVLCSTLTFAASANPITYCGARPVFIDSDFNTWNMDPEMLEEELRYCAKRGVRPKAIIVVDLYGQCADYGRILAVAERYGVPVVEDAAEALGATYENQYAGTFGAMGILSFNGNKIITTSGGGMLLSWNKTYTDNARHLATQARDEAPYYLHSSIGYNYRLSNILAAIGRGQLLHLEDKVARRRQINRFYRDSFSDVPGVTFMPEAAYGRSNCWLTCILIDPDTFGASNEEVRLALEEENIESRRVWKPMHQQPVFAGCRIRRGTVADEIFARGLCLPSGSALEMTDLERVTEIVRNVCAHV